MYWRDNVSILPEGINKLPPAEATDYLYSRSTSPPVLLTAVQHFIEFPTHAPRSTVYLDRIPKKVGVAPKVAKDGSHTTGYGLRLCESICWTKTIVVECCIAVAASVIATVWCTRNDGSLQDGCSIAGVILAYGTLLLVVVQGLAQQQSTKNNSK